MFTKILLGSGVLIGAGTAGTYFGTRETIEDFFKKEFKSESLSIPTDWNAHKSKLKNPPNDDISKVKSFLNLSDNNDLNDLESSCSGIYSRTYKVFGISYMNIDQSLKDGLKKYCFSSPSSS